MLKSGISHLIDMIGPWTRKALSAVIGVFTVIFGVILSAYVSGEISFLEFTQYIEGLTFPWVLTAILFLLNVFFIETAWSIKHHYSTLQQVQASLQTVPKVDPFTGIQLREKFVETLLALPKRQEELYGYEGLSRKFCLVVIDIKGSRHLNETSFRPDATRFIQAFAGIIEAYTRNNEKPFHFGPRYDPDRFHSSYLGGDEFILLLEGNEIDALFFLIRLRRNLINNKKILTESLGKKIRVDALTGRVDDRDNGKLIDPLFDAAIFELENVTEEVVAQGVERVEAVFREMRLAIASQTVKDEALSCVLWSSRNIGGAYGKAIADFRSLNMIPVLPGTGAASS